ncbi:aromatic acid exporter family protein [Nonomuraea sp. NPDC050556]|uniref:aromatic acid exporter family protein n=1 Tax=Nonomuraea sp. NPDC050556 TaxID=3364369 RepID=UPI00378AC812
MRLLRRELTYFRAQLTALAEPGSRQRLELLQIAKATLAAVLAWLLAGILLAHESLWIAPATAVIMVHATVYQTLTNGLRKVAAVAAGVILAGGIGHLMGLTALSLALVIPPALVASRWHRMGRHGTDLATTAVLLLSFGAGSQDRYLASYVLATAVGALCGAAVNTLLWPPLYRSRPYVALQRLGRRAAVLLHDVATAVERPWDLSELPDFDRGAQRLDEQLTIAGTAVADGKESRRYNLRRLTSPATVDHGPALAAMATIAQHVHTIIRALTHLDPEHVSDEYARDYAQLLHLLADLIGARVDDPDDVGAQRELHQRAHAQTVRIHRQMSTEIRNGDVDHPDGWAVSGSLLTEAEHLLTLLEPTQGVSLRGPGS